MTIPSEASGEDIAYGFYLDDLRRSGSLLRSNQLQTGQV